MDFLMEREDNILSLDKDSISKSDQKGVEGMDVSYSICGTWKLF
jgi:hypothetical protein